MSPRIAGAFGQRREARRMRKVRYERARDRSLVALKRKVLNWTYDRTNDAEIWKQELDLERINRAASLQTIDSAQAFQEYQALADLGSVWSMVRLGWAYQQGLGTIVDMGNAEAWYRRAYEHGSGRAALYLGYLLGKRGDAKACSEIYRTAIEKNWAPAMNELAWSYMRSPINDRNTRPA